MANVCRQTGELPPPSDTLMASKTNPASEAWIVRTNCEVAKIPVRGRSLDLEGQGISRVLSLPTDAVLVSLMNNDLKDGADFTSATKMTKLSLSSVSPKLVNNVAFPTSLVELDIINSDITRLGSMKIPNSVKVLSLTGNQITSLKGFKWPTALVNLYLTNNKLTSVDFELPDKLETLNLDQNAITMFEKVNLPPTLSFFTCRMIMVSVVRGVKWPPALVFVNFFENPITAFEIRQSDVPLAAKFAFADTGGSRCAPPATVGGTRKNVCVISDETFENKYVRNIPPPAVTPTPSSAVPTAPAGGSPRGDLSTTSPTGVVNTPEPTSAPSGSAGSSGSNPASPSPTPGDSISNATVLNDKSPSRSSSSSSSSRSSSSGSGGGNGSMLSAVKSQRPSLSNSTFVTNSTTGSQASSDPTVALPPPVPPSSSSSSGNHALAITGAVVGGLLICLVASVLIYRTWGMFKLKRSRPKPTRDIASAYRLATDPPDTGTGKANNSAKSNDIRFDKSLAKFRIERKEIVLGQQIARGGFGVIYRGHYDGRDVAIKRMLPDTWRNDTVRASFMDEIRLCASLEHAKVVEFIGISWSSLRDLAVVIEFMAGGDLCALLHAQRESSPAPPSPLAWSQPWTPSQIKSKTSIALDVAEAVVYLHSYNSPILHRDLKAKNVLLDLEGNAKLSDFGISRELSVDETMTSEVGTIAWIAPEVLKGERYSEKADIYSLGVLLVELDRCQHPYADEPALQMGASIAPRQSESWKGAPVDDKGLIGRKNTQIAVLVSTGQLRPRVSSECPELVASLVAQCLSYDATDRPTAVDVFYQLRQVRTSLS